MGNLLFPSAPERVFTVLLHQAFDSRTASAAELLAAALHSHGRATVIGSRTFGKGLVHGMQPLSDGAMLILTMGALQTLEGREILHNGIVPDVLEEMPASPVVDASVALASPQDRQYQKAVAILVK